jgi:short-subunit dehydrogenase
MTDRWLILGASSPVARAFARSVATEGAEVLLAGRDVSDLAASAGDARLHGSPHVEVVEWNAAEPESCDRLVAAALGRPGPLYVLVAAAVMPDQSALDLNPDEIDRMIATNISGPIRVVQGVVPRLEHERSGAVVILGSVAGDRGRRKNYLYGSTKAALAVYASGLRARLFPSRVSVTLIKPGFMDTGMTWGMPGLFLVASPEEAAHGILAASRKGRGSVYLPGFWLWIMLVIRHLPDAIMKRLNI